MDLSAEFLISAFVTLFVVIDPLGTAPMFTAITANETQSSRRQIAKRGVAIATVILVAFAIIGRWLLDALAVQIEAFRIAGGILLFLVAVDMLFAHQTPLTRTTPDETEEAIRRHDVSVFPLSIPLIAGPGAMTSIVLLMGNASSNLAAQLAVLAVLLTVMGLMLAALLTAAQIERLLGRTGSNVVTRVLGLILAALATQYVLTGVADSLASAA